MPGDWSFGEYMRRKQNKLHKQHDADAKLISDIFHGVGIYVNGETDPSASELKRLMQSHGGKYEVYLRPSIVTHIVANNLCAAKISQLGNQLVVSPAWITDSVAAGHRLPVGPYLVYNRVGPGQPRLNFGVAIKAKQSTATPTEEEEEECIEEKEEEEGGGGSGDGGDGDGDGGEKGGDSAVAALPTSAILVMNDSNAATAASTNTASTTATGAATKAAAAPINVAFNATTTTTTSTTTTTANGGCGGGMAAAGSVVGLPLGNFASKTPPRTPTENPYARRQRERKKQSPSRSISTTGRGDGGSGGTTASITSIAAAAAATTATTTPNTATLPHVHRRPDANHVAEVMDERSSHGNPNFVEQFLSQSRLHHLSTTCVELKRMVRQRLRQQGIIPTVPAPTRLAPRVVVHIDMDSFFVSVGLRSRPELRDKPVVVAHGSTGGHSEISSCNYVARECGVRNGSWMAKAVAKCPNLVAIPYEFDAYKLASRKFYDILLRFCSAIQVVSMDEAFLDLTGLVRPDPMSPDSDSIGMGGDLSQGTCSGSSFVSSGGPSNIPAAAAAPSSAAPSTATNITSSTITLAASTSSAAATAAAAAADDGIVAVVTAGSGVVPLPSASSFVARIRQAVEAELGCTASAGISNSILLARMATRQAKPNGQFYLHPERAQSFLDGLPARSLPGVGWSLGARLSDMGVTTCADLRALSKVTLRASFGEKTGEMLHNFCRGHDARPVDTRNEEPKTISVEITWGVRFNEFAGVERFIGDIVKRVAGIAAQQGRRGRKITLKVMVRKPGAKSSRKHLGHGSCDVRNKVHQFHTATADETALSSACLACFCSMGISPLDVRGIGISLTSLTPSGSGGSSSSSGSGGISSDGGAAVTGTALRGNTNNNGGMTQSVASYFKPAPPPSRTELETRAEVETPIEPRAAAGAGAAAASAAAAVPPQSTIAEHVGLPAQAELDLTALAALPPDIQAEIRAAYGDAGKVDLVAAVTANISSDARVPAEASATIINGITEGESEETSWDFDALSPGVLERQRREYERLGRQHLGAEAGGEEPLIEAFPETLSQVDPHTLSELPRDVQADIERGLRRRAADIEADKAGGTLQAAKRSRKSKGKSKGDRSSKENNRTSASAFASVEEEEEEEDAGRVVGGISATGGMARAERIRATGRNMVTKTSVPNGEGGIQLCANCSEEDATPALWLCCDCGICFCDECCRVLHKRLPHHNLFRLPSANDSTITATVNASVAGSKPGANAAVVVRASSNAEAAAAAASAAIGTSSAIITLAGHSQPEAARRALRACVAADTQNGCLEFAAEVGVYTERLIRAHRMDEAEVALRTFFRLATRHPAWQPGFDLALGKVQRATTEMYGGELWGLAPFAGGFEMEDKKKTSTLG